MDKLQIAWCSGFIEGDGSFDPRQRWRVTSTQREHVERLQRTFGGHIYESKVAKSHYSPKWEWNISTKRHGPKIEIILPGLFETRRTQLRSYGFTLPNVVNEFSEEQWWAWLAGFIDAEGHVCGTGASLSTNLILVQVDSDEPLQKAKALIGAGSINWHPNKWNGAYRYGVYGKNADKALDKLMPFLSSYRKNQIENHRIRQQNIRRVVG